MNSLHSIAGTWKLPSAMVEGRDEFMHIGEDGRIVHFVYTDSSGERSTKMLLWAESLGEDQYLMRTQPGEEGWTVRMFLTERGMTIDRAELQFGLARAIEAEIPEWYSQQLADALSRMSERELGANKAEPADRGDHSSSKANP